MKSTSDIPIGAFEQTIVCRRSFGYNRKQKNPISVDLYKADWYPIRSVGSGRILHVEVPDIQIQYIRQ